MEKPSLARGLLAPTAGFEPTTNRLTAGCSTTELCRNGYRGSHYSKAFSGCLPLCEEKPCRIESLNLSFQMMLQEVKEIEIQFVLVALFEALFKGCFLGL